MKNELQENENSTDYDKELMKLVNENIIEFIKNIDIHIQKRDFDKINASCHKMKFGLNIAKINSLLSIVNSISIEAKNNEEMKHIKFLYHQFKDEYLRMKKEIVL